VGAERPGSTTEPSRAQATVSAEDIQQTEAREPGSQSVTTDRIRVTYSGTKSDL
jgi:hypothetical protein